MKPMDRSGVTFRALTLHSTLLLICMTVAFCHLGLSLHELEPVTYYSFGAREPFIYRILIPALFRLLPINLTTCSTHLRFPIEHCADVAALVVDWLALALACVVLAAAFRAIAAHASCHLKQPALVIPVFVWMVIFDYILVPNAAMYYPYDFLQLFFFAIAVWLGVSARGGYWCLPLLAFIGAFNKEDAIFIPLTAAIYSVLVRKLDRRMILSVAAAAVAVFLAKYVSLMYVRQVIKLPALNPTLYENHLLFNLHQVLNPIAWLGWLSAFGGGAILMALPLRRTGRLKVFVLSLIAAWVPVVFLVGESREVRLLGPLICPMLLPVMVTLEELLYGSVGIAGAAASSAEQPVPTRLFRLPLAAAAMGIVVILIGIQFFLHPVGIGSGKRASPVAARVGYRDLLSCEGARIHGCKTADGQAYDCLFTNDSQSRIEISDTKVWNYDTSNMLLERKEVDTQFAMPPGRTVHFEFHNSDKNAVHGRLCGRDPISAANIEWFDATY